MLFEAARVYARGEPGGADAPPQSLRQQMERLPLDSIQPNNWVLGFAGLLVLAWLAHKFLDKGKRR